jgi:hypothetical protein
MLAYESWWLFVKALKIKAGRDVPVNNHLAFFS